MTKSAYFTDFPDLYTPDAHLDVIYKDGKFLDARSKKRIRFSYDKNQFPDGIHLKILAPLFSLTKKDQKNHTKEKKAIILPSGSILIFEIQSLTFSCKIEKDLQLKQIGNRPSFLSPCKCSIVDVKDRNGKSKSPLIIRSYDSLNQAYTGSSIQFFPEKKFHTANVFKKFRTSDGWLLNILRNSIEVEVFNK